jgi:hypothetical protein
MDPGEVKIQSWRPRDSLLHWPVGAALLLSFVGALLLLLRQRAATS